MICINFNINNHTNNNIIGNGNNINNFYFNSKNQNKIPNQNNIIINNTNKNNIQSERIKKLIQKKYETNNNSLYLGLNGFTLSQINSPLNTAIKTLIKNNKNINSKIKPKKNQSKKYFHNNSLMKNLSKSNLSQAKAQKNKLRNKNNYLELINLTNKNNSINNQSRRTFSHSFSNKDFSNKKTQKKNIAENTHKEMENNIKVHDNANTISVNGESNYKNSLKRFNKIPIGRISHRTQKNKCSLKNEYIETLNQLSKEKKIIKSKIKSLDKFDEKNIEKVKHMNEIKNCDKNNDKKINRKTNSIGNYIYSKRSMLVRKQIQFTSPAANLSQKDEKIKFNNNENSELGQNDVDNNNYARTGSQINIFPKNKIILSTNNTNQIFSERIHNKKNKDNFYNDKEEKKNINTNKDINIIRRSLQKNIPSGMAKKIKVNKIINLNG
jgi:hypothetical protein